MRAAARRLLARAGDPAVACLEAEVLLAHVLGTTRSRLLAARAPDAPERARFEALVAERAETGRPVAYLVGHREFRDLRLAVDGRVLIPRPETESVLEALEELLAEGRLPPRPVVDRGTGSGCLALCASAHRDVVALDLSAGALEVAGANLETLRAARPPGGPAAGRVWLLRADGLRALRAGRFAAVLANPPYVEPREFADLPEDVRRHEPRAALVPGEGSVQGVFGRLVEESRDLLAPGGWLLTEVGAGQADLVRRLALGAGFDPVRTRRDLAGHERVVLARRP